MFYESNKPENSTYVRHLFIVTTKINSKYQNDQKLSLKIKLGDTKYGAADTVNRRSQNSYFVFCFDLINLFTSRRFNFKAVCAIWTAAGQFLILQLRPNRVIRWFDVFLCGLEFKICCKNLTDRKVNLPKNGFMSITNNLKFRNTHSRRVKILSLHEIHGSWHNVDLANWFSGRSLTFDIYLKIVSKMFWIPIQILSGFLARLLLCNSLGDSKRMKIRSFPQKIAVVPLSGSSKQKWKNDFLMEPLILFHITS